ncbi:MAG TPA: endolytic transglycosylase MltG [Acidimicrobiales bacterium]|nr:endolytic transglycosylase MltG [Acidimicrobiales bacterium]
MSRVMWRLLLGAVVGLVGTGAGLAWYQGQVNPSGAPGEAVAVKIPDGSSPERIAAILDERGVVGSARLFRVYLRINGGGDLKAGDYLLQQRADFGDVVDQLQAGPKRSFDRLTIPEGFTLKQIAERVGKLPGRSKDAFLAAATSGRVRSEFQPDNVDNLEGLLFPDTYFVDRRDTEETILERMVTTFDQIAREEGLAKASNPYEKIIVASLVESEGKVAVDRPKIAQVIYNRLRVPMLLQIDATVIYARGGVRRPDGRTLFSDLEVDSPYNTYKIKGLPPTPISAAGRTAIAAALEPQAGPWLYYVKFQTDGTHKFSTTLAEHNAAIKDAKRRGVNP